MYIVISSYHKDLHVFVLTSESNLGDVPADHYLLLHSNLNTPLIEAYHVIIKNKLVRSQIEKIIRVSHSWPLFVDHANTVGHGTELNAYFKWQHNFHFDGGIYGEI